MERIAGLLQNYDFATPETISYFRHWLDQAPKDVAFGLAWVLDHAVTETEQDRAAAALTFKTEVLWEQLDALYAAYVAPGHVPPGGWQPGEGLAS
jgi:pyrroloquinoline-quinone synthase